MEKLAGEDDAIRKFLDTRKGGSENLYTSKPTHGIIIMHTDQMVFNSTI